MRSHASLLPPLIVLVLAGCVSLPAAGRPPRPAAACVEPALAMAETTLYFGRAMPGGVVSDADWERFLTEEITPRFPDGLTVWDAAGQWRGADGQVVREPSKVVRLFHGNDTETLTRLDEIVGLYQTRFQQEAVLRAHTTTCVRF